MGKRPRSTPGKKPPALSVSGRRLEPVVNREPPRKKPPAPSVRRGRRAATADITALIIGEIYGALERLGADPELLAIVGSWRDTLDDAEVLALLRRYNATGRALRPLR
jgi:hypothetical protein